MWAKALFEGLYGSKDQASQNIIEDIIEELDEARKSSDKTHFAQVLFDRLFNQEPQHLLTSLGDRLTKSETEVSKEEKEETQAFLEKIKPLKFADYKDSIEIEATD